MTISPGKVLGVIGGLIPLVWIGWLLRHFVGVGGGTAEGVAGIGLGPTVIGLSIVGLLFALPLIIKLLRATTGVDRVPGASFETKLKPGEVVVEPAFDADAAFANYMRKREAGVVGNVSVNPADHESSEPFAPRPSGFGRKSV
ncbi:hypothetical protein [Sphingopyxis sp.]|jgi:hypothetical protein|uniref:hypothetical protein n=1 Tax=Sphingopyxis sp. TaxID=1908224 RepID=UPI0025E894EC|nr:hypothetical protein [Sphingopyxis sp.]MBK6414391.1 hypothetical protein [Sphingopyxis sp.]